MSTDEEFWIGVHVQGKRVMVSAGNGSQRVKWLAYVAVAKWDEDNQQGWRRLGVPTSIRLGSKSGGLLDFGAIIKDELQNGDEIYVTTSLHPDDTK